ncbi:YgfZ/GcvT domain-containing protein [Roseobacter ponti]|uniref:Folate-binding protein YgfZ n=1 Tax=Roseobacter ponti TaxID=1891787 RepID=A0A858SSQ2_9RHOB|nr:folate-binding protein YgfZ [Roseobacter ponti]QJF50621.1 folate-binding protein YgfZ [Roseobacter ponti]
MSKRRTLKLTGHDVDDFLQGLITNDIARLKNGLVYAALLTPQGKYIADFFLLRQGDVVLLDVADPLADMLLARLNMYKLRADVAIAPVDLHVHRGTGERPEDGFADPRHEALGWRAYRDTPQEDDDTDWTALRVAHLIPQSGVELTPDTFILEAGFERLNGVDFRKGCYVGQEVTARMKHKTELRKGLARVSVQGPAETGEDITVSGKPAGTLLTRSGDAAIAYLRYDRAKEPMQAGTARVLRTDA